MARARFISALKQLVRKPLEKLAADPVVLPLLYLCARTVIVARRPLVIAVTGSVGKTTTVNVITSVLTDPAARAIAGSAAGTVANMNNDVGLPLTILRRDAWLNPSLGPRLLELAVLPLRALRLAFFGDYPDVLVLELAAGPEGHIGRSVRIAPPQIGVVTTIGPTHLERFGDEKGVMVEKSGVVSAVRASGLVVLGEGHAFVESLERRCVAPVVRVSGRGIEMSRNIARAVAQYLRIPDDVVEGALARFRMPKGRLNRLGLGPFSVIDDSYNANPLSMKLALDTLVDAHGRRVAVLGTMAELGTQSGAYHTEIGAYAHERSDVVIGVGEHARAYQGHHWFATSAECAEAIGAIVQPGDCVLVKGSASVQMFRIVGRLKAIAAAVAAAG